MATYPNKTRSGSKRRHDVMPEERERKRKEQREHFEQACRELLTSDGWRRWIKIRATNGLSRYSVHNQFLLALQGIERELELSYVTGFRTFKKLGRAVRKGEKALWVWAPRAVLVDQDGKIVRNAPKTRPGLGQTATDGGGPSETPGLKHRVYFRAVAVFDASQTEEIPGAEVVPLAPPMRPLDGESHEHLLDPLRKHAAELGYTVEERELEPNGPGGWCDYANKLIVVGRGPANRRVRVLVHELAHAHGIGYKEYSRRQAEVMVDSVTHIVLANAGLDVGGETIPYVTGWGERDELEAIAAYAEKIDEVATSLEGAIAAAAPVDGSESSPYSRLRGSLTR